MCQCPQKTRSKSETNERVVRNMQLCLTLIYKQSFFIVFRWNLSGRLLLNVAFSPVAWVKCKKMIIVFYLNYTHGRDPEFNPLLFLGPTQTFIKCLITIELINTSLPHSQQYLQLHGENIHYGPIILGCIIFRGSPWFNLGFCHAKSMQFFVQIHCICRDLNVLPVTSTVQVGVCKWIYCTLTFRRVLPDMLVGLLTGLAMAASFCRLVCVCTLLMLYAHWDSVQRLWDFSLTHNKQLIHSRM